MGDIPGPVVGRSRSSSRSVDSGDSGDSGDGQPGRSAGGADRDRGEPEACEGSRGDPGHRGNRDRRAAAADADPEAIARQICLRLLSAAPRTQAQLAAALRRQGVPADAAAAVLERFAEVKLIDDELFARAWVESRHYARGLAGRALGAELRQRGVDAGDIETALGQLDPEQELATARDLVDRRLAATDGMPTLARVRRLTGVLARKGYSPGLAYRVVREALERDAEARSTVTYGLDELPEPADDDVPSEP